MPRPPAEYIPEPIRAYAKSHGLTVAELSVQLGHSYNWIYRIFQSDQDHLLPYIRIADAAGITLDELVLIIEAKQGAALIRKLQNGGSIYRLSKDIKVSEGLLNTILKNTGKLNALKSLVQLARSTNCKVADLVTGSEISELSA